MEWHKERQNAHGHRKEIPSNHDLFPSVWINKETTTYLKDTAAAKQTRDNVKALVQGITEIDTENKLTRLQKLQIINLRPISAASLVAIVPQCTQWFGPEKLKTLLECIRKHLPEQDEDNDDEDDEDEVDDDEYDDLS